MNQSGESVPAPILVGVAAVTLIEAAARAERVRNPVRSR